MTLRDDIARLWGQSPAGGDISAAIAAGLERDNYLVKLADLPELSEDVKASLDNAPDTAADFMADVRWHLAQALYVQSRESEAAALEARRDELARELFGYESRRDASPPEANAIYHIIAERDRATAAEAEVARLTKEAGR